MQPWQREKIDTERAFHIAVASMKRIGRYGDKLGVGLCVSNENKHWRFFMGKRVAEYWPMSSRLVFDRQYRVDPITDVKDIFHVLRIIRLRWSLSRSVPLPKPRVPDGLDEYMQRYTEYILLDYKSRNQIKWERYMERYHGGRHHPPGEPI